MTLKDTFKRLSPRELLTFKAVICLAVVLAFAAASHLYNSRAERRLESEKKGLAELLKLTGEYASLQARVAPLSGKISSGGSVSAASAVQAMLKRIGVKGGSFKRVDVTQEPGYRADGAELTLEGVTINQVMNLLHMINNDGRLLIVKEFALKAGFKRPDTFDAKLVVELPVRQD